jgi:PAS domain S-box-containing protein
MAASTELWSAADVESFVHEYYDAWGGTDLDHIMSYYAEEVVLQIPGLLMEGKEAVRDQFARPFITAFPGNRHLVKNMIFGPGAVNVEFSFEAQHKGPFAGHAATGARVKLPGCGVYEYDSAKRQITAGRIYFDVGTLLQTITDSLLGDRKKAEEALRTNERNLSLITNVIPTFIHVLRSDGSVLYANQAVLGYTGLTLEEVRKDDYRVRVFHPEDVERLREERRVALTRPVPFENEQRVLGKDGKYRWFLIRFNPLLDAQGKVDRWYVAAFDIEDRKRAEDALARQAGVRADVSVAFSGPTNLGEILRGCMEAIVRHLDAAFARIWTLNKDESMLELQASAGMYTRLDGSYSRIPVGDLKVGLIAREKKAHFTNDVLSDPRVNDKAWARDNGMVAFAGYPLVVEDRLIGVVALFARRPLSESILDTLASVADTISQGIERKRAEEELRESEAYLAEAQKLSQTGSWAWNPTTDDITYWSEECYRVLGFEPSGPLPRFEEFLQRIHSGDQAGTRNRFEKAIRDKADFELDYRIVHPDKGVRDIHVVGHAVLDPSGDLREFVGTVIDITESKRAEKELQQLVDLIPQLTAVAGPDGQFIHVNRVTREYTGLTLEEFRSQDGIGKVVHPDDQEKIRAERNRGFSGILPFEYESRMLGKDGVYRWFLIRYNPLVEAGRVRRWFGTATEIESRKQEEEQVRQENVRLEERTRIAQELHDTLLQSVCAATLKLGAAMNALPSDSLLKAKIDPILDLMEQGMAEGRKAIQGLRSSDSTAPDLVAALSQIQKELVVPPEVDFQVSVVGQQRPVRAPICQELYRIGKEALANAFSHSRAKRVDLELEYTDNKLSIRVRDNGCGIAPQVLEKGREGHWGVAGMRERAARIGGLLKISSSATAGTEIQLSIPGEVVFQSLPSEPGSARNVA